MNTEQMSNRIEQIIRQMIDEKDKEVMLALLAETHKMMLELMARIDDVCKEIDGEINGIGH